MKKLLPVLLALAGLGIGTGTGLALRGDGPASAPDGAVPASDPETEAAAPPEDNAETAAMTDPAKPPDEAAAAEEHGADPAHPVEYVRFNNQFVIPIVERAQVVAMVVLALSLEVSEGQTDRVYALEPKLRDALLQVMFDHANSGGFSGDFTDGAALEPLRVALREASIRVFGPEVKDVLISDLMRQDN